MSKQTDIAYQYIREKIVDGTFMPSQKLIEIQLAEVIGVSRSTVKKALLKLKEENLVEIKDNKGATIKSFTLEEVLNYLEIREVLEGLVARSAANNISDEDLQRLKLILDEMEGYQKNNEFDKYSGRNKDFHAIIYNSAKNVQAVEIIKMIRTQLIRYQFRTILVPGRNQSSFAEHTAIYKALKARDEKLVEEAVRKHITEVRRTIQNNYRYLV